MMCIIMLSPHFELSLQALCGWLMVIPFNVFHFQDVEDDCLDILIISANGIKACYV